MPGFDRRGPMGQGPGTGWGRGPCVTGRSAQEYAGGAGYGVGRGGRPWGGGLGRCFGGRRGGRGGWFRGALPFFGGPADPSQEADLLRADLEAARQSMAAMEARLKELEKEPSND